MWPHRWQRVPRPVRLSIAVLAAAGLHLTVLVLITDAAANLYAGEVLDRATTASRAGLTVITCLAVASIVVTRYAGPCMRRPG